MSKFKEYRILSKDVREKRNAMRTARAKITSYNQECFLDAPGSYDISACINKFEHVYGICMDPHAYEDGEFTKFCPLFGSEPCMNRTCNMFQKNSDYIVACERYKSAVAKRREFVKNLFKSK